MCGIFGAISVDSSSGLLDNLIAGLSKLEYRGYDSAGVAYLDPDSDKLNIIKTEGKIAALAELISQYEDPNKENAWVAISHTRWATHGKPSVRNAHPIVSENFAIVFNGIIENYEELKQELQAAGQKFESDTDTEVIPKFMQHLVNQGVKTVNAIRQVVERLEGRFAFLLLSDDGSLYCYRNGAPMVVGSNAARSQIFIASDALAIAEGVSELLYLEDSQLIELVRSENEKSDADNRKPQSVNIIAHSEHAVVFVPNEIKASAVSRGEFAHYMLKEIYEQKKVITNIIDQYFNRSERSIHFPDQLPKIVMNRPIKYISIVACGTSYHAGMVAKNFFEDMARIKTGVNYSSEFRHTPLLNVDETLYIFISQSGETADTLAALEYVKKAKGRIVSFVNTTESSIAHKSDVVLPLLAGPEIGVASTKAFTAQCLVLSLLCLYLAELSGKIDQKKMVSEILSLADAVSHIDQIINNPELDQIAKSALADKKLVLFIGRGVSFPLALEGALKLKEISYISAEGIAAGELKHGPIALIDEAVPTIAIVPYDDLFRKTLSNINEIKSRGGKIIALSCNKGLAEIGKLADYGISMPNISDMAAPLLYAIPLQLLSYYTALKMEREIDQPRNLAKSVTVE